MRGEAQEREIEQVLRERFPSDRIVPVKSGQRGADVLQTVNARGDACGAILWESKRARNWSNVWVSKLKEDQTSAKADIAVLVCATLPPTVRHMDMHEGVWVVDFASVAPIATVLRQALVGIAQARSIDMNRSHAMDAIYSYLSSAEFVRHVRGIVEAHVEMRNDLDGEKRAMERMWGKRGKQIDCVENHMSGMWGELEALMGSALPAVEMLELRPPVELRSAS